MSEEEALLGGFNLFLYSTLIVWAQLFGLWLVVSVALLCAAVAIIWYAASQLTGDKIEDTL